MRARKRFGQHFLHDQRVLEQISSVVNLAASHRVFEIGPGQGALTDVMLPLAGHYLAVEIDRDFIPWLQARHPSLILVNDDVLKLDLSELLQSSGETCAWRIIGNLPYNISSALIVRLLEFVRASPDGVVDMHFMLQKEMADRIAAVPGNKSWGRLSVWVQMIVNVELLFDVAPDSFNPPPKVWSSVVRLTPKSDLPSGQLLEGLDRVLRLAFAGRRKRLSNSLKTLGIDWTSAGVDSGLRPDNVTADQFVALAKASNDVAATIDVEAATTPNKDNEA